MTQMLDFPVTTLSEPYWQAAAEHRLVAPRCNACDKFFFAPEIACTHCFSLDWRWENVAGDATLYSYTIIHRAPQPGMATPYVLGAFDLPEGFSMFAHLVDCPPETLECGLAVTVDFRPLHDGRIAPVFKPRN